MIRRPRERFVARIHEIVGRIQAADCPVTITAVYVFGSYARGALLCGDVDLILVLDGWDAERLPKDRILGVPRVHPYIRQTIVGRGLPVDEVVVFRGDPMPTYSSAPILIWTPTAPDVDAALRKIPLDPEAGRFQRDYLVSPRRIYDGVEGLTALAEAQAAGVLTVERLPIDRAAPPPWSASASRAQCGWHASFTGRERQRLYPYACDWLTRQGVEYFLVGERHWNHGDCYGYTATGDLFLCDLGCPKLERATLRLMDAASPGSRRASEFPPVRWSALQWQDGVPSAVYLLPSLRTHDTNEALVLRRAGAS